MSTVLFEQVILRDCGIDVHRDVVVATISGEGLASWAGICPGNDESAGKKSGRTTHGNKQLKAVITEAG